MGKYLAIIFFHHFSDAVILPAVPNVFQQVNPILNRLEELQRQFDDIAQEVQVLNRSLSLVRQGAIEHRIVDGPGYLPWPADITPSYTTTASIFGDDANSADTPVSVTSYAGNSRGQLAQDNALSDEWLSASQSTMSSDVNIQIPMHNVSIFYRNGTKRYRCQCGGETERKGDMRRHLKGGNHLPPQFACVCGRRFTRKDVRNTHEKKCLEAQHGFST